jgi:hypothetical protein
MTLESGGRSESKDLPRTCRSELQAQPELPKRVAMLPQLLLAVSLVSYRYLLLFQRKTPTFRNQEMDVDVESRGKWGLISGPYCPPLAGRIHCIKTIYRPRLPR